jgi:hypothetical protein
MLGTATVIKRGQCNASQRGGGFRFLKFVGKFFYKVFIAEKGRGQ